MFLGASDWPMRVLDALGVAVIATDLTGRIRYWNPAAEELYGWPIGPVLGRSILEVIPTEIDAQQPAVILARLQRGGSWEGECWLRRQDGSRFLAHVSDRPIRD